MLGKKRRKLKSTTLICRHCGEIFTSKISFNLHQQRHIEAARKEGIALGENDAAAKIFKVESVPLPTKVEKMKVVSSEDVVEAVLYDTSHEESMPEVTISTVSAVKSLLADTKDERAKRGKYFKYSPELRDEIAEYALKHGSLEAADHYSRVVGNPLSESTIRNFVKAFQLFSQELKQEMGKYAYQFGIEACHRVYKEKMPQGVELLRATIKRFKELFIAKNPDLPLVEDEDDNEPGPPEVGNATNAVEGKQKFVFETSLKNDIGRYAFHCGNTNAVHHFSSKLRFPMKESTVRKFKKAWMEQNDMEIMITNEDDFNNDSQSAPLPLTVESSARSYVIQGVNAGPIKLKKRVVRPVKVENNDKDRRSRRGQYSNYNPALRAEIARYAADHGNQDTISFIKEKHGIDVPESTVRGLRDRLLAKKRQKRGGEEDLSQLNHGRRGRPMRLGKYDPIVQKCIFELVASGEKPSSFMVVATAKQVLMEHDPNLLAENGGHIQLNTTWAKSFLKRLNLLA